ncbi:MAG: methyltransferase domain-containing protein [Pyrinomonadaceae bacterium]
MNEWLRNNLVCPRDKQELDLKNNRLVCPDNHIYPIISDVPIMLVDDAVSTHGYIEETLAKVSEFQASEELTETKEEAKGETEVDWFVQHEVPYTSGNLYFAVQNKLTRYPIPETRLKQGSGERLLDIGCNWGRWSIAAARKNYRPVGIDPSLNAILAARRVSKQLGVECEFIVGDARFLPFADDAFDVVFCYSVYQHLSKENVRTSLDEVSRVLKTNGKTLIQMSNKYGIRQYQQHRRRGFTEGEGFEIRYWTPSELLETFKAKIGDTVMTTDCYFGLGIQNADADLLPVKYKMVVYSSAILRKLSQFIKPMVKVADSVYLHSINRKNLK